MDEHHDHDLFVSHSHGDARAVRKLVREWEAWGYDVYADFKDPALVRASRKNVMTAKLADRLREAIRHCAVFVFVASERSLASGWMPWELGLAHGAVGRVHLYFLNSALRATFAPREYLELYRASSFDADAARAYLAKVVAQARAEATKPSEREHDRDWALRAIEALRQGRVEQIVRELTQYPIERTQGPLDVTGAEFPSISSATVGRPRR